MSIPFDAPTFLGVLLGIGVIGVVGTAGVLVVDWYIDGKATVRTKILVGFGIAVAVAAAIAIGQAVRFG